MGKLQIPLSCMDNDMTLLSELDRVQLSTELPVPRIELCRSLVVLLPDGYPLPRSCSNKVPTNDPFADRCTGEVSAYMIQQYSQQLLEHRVFECRAPFQ